MKNINKHLLFWLCYTLYFSILDWIQLPHINILDQIVYVLIHVWIFYSAYYFLMQFSVSGKKKAIKSFSLFLLSIGVFFCLNFGYYYFFLPYIDPLAKRNLSLRFRTIDGIVWYNQFFFYAVGYYYARRFIKKERDLRLAEQERKKLLEEKLALEQSHHNSEKERILTEYAYLRAQINPHFLHNTLNFFYAKSLPCSAELSDAILTLSNIMRYSLQNEEDSRGMVWLNKEVEHLQQVIKINQLRFSNKLQIGFSITGNTEGIRIIPLVLITLVENSFKHGELTDSTCPVIINLAVDASGKKLHFEVRNRKKKGPKELSQGIGLDNTRRRLDWMYDNRYSFTIQDNGDIYSTELTLPVITGDPEITPATNPIIKTLNHA